MAAEVVDFILDFGTHGTTAVATVTGQTGLTAAGYVEPFFQGGSTAENSVENHAVLSSMCKPIARNITTGQFEVLAVSLEPVTGTFQCHAVWSVA
jgi:hypothetical protein